MKLISLWEPWATLMAIGAKRIETRSWETLYRGWLAIHASKNGMAKAQMRDTMRDPFFSGCLANVDLSPGCIVAVVKLEGCVRTQDLRQGIIATYKGILTAQEIAFGDYHDGRFGWITTDRFRLARPIPYKATQGLCNVSPEALEEIRTQWKEAENQIRSGGAK